MWFGDLCVSIGGIEVGDSCNCKGYHPFFTVFIYLKSVGVGYIFGCLLGQISGWGLLCRHVYTWGYYIFSCLGLGVPRVFGYTILGHGRTDSGKPIHLSWEGSG